MDMPMQQVAWFEDAHKRQKAFEALMGAVWLVVNTPGRRMGDQHIKEAPIAQFVRQAIELRAPHPPTPSPRVQGEGEP